MDGPYGPWLEAVNGQQDWLLERTLAWSVINSGSRNAAGVAAMADALEEAARPLGATVERFQPEPLVEVDLAGRTTEVPLGPVLILTRARPGARVRVLLTGHLDTVFAVDHPFQSPRWLDDNTVNGPGVTDLKGGLAVMLAALKALEASPWGEQVDWQILLNPDEEIGSPASAPYLARAARERDLGLVYEPALADGTLAGGRKGSGNWTAVVRGRAAHAGREHHLGRNAVVALARFVTGLDRLNGQRPGVTVNPARFEGGGPPNVVPDLAGMRFNIRLGDTDEQTWVEEQLQGLVEEINRLDGIELTLHGGITRPPKPRFPALFDLVADCGRQLNIPVRFADTGGCCDGNNLAACGLPNVDTLGVRGGDIHSAREYLLVDSLVERARLSALLLMRLGAGDCPAGFRP